MLRTGLISCWYIRIGTFVLLWLSFSLFCSIILTHHFFNYRVAHGQNNYVSDNAFGDDVDLVVWGHEHDCINKAGAVPVTDRKYFISQPGSSVATSLARGEAIPKSALIFLFHFFRNAHFFRSIRHVSLLKIQGKEFEMTPLRLRSVRPFLFDEVSLYDAQEEADDNQLLDSKIKVNKFLRAKVSGN